MIAICDEHGVELESGRCPKCQEIANENFITWMAENKLTAITHGGFHPVTKGWVQIDGKRVEYCHATAYVDDRTVPIGLEKEIEAIQEEMESRIESKINEFETICNCYICHRTRQEQMEKSL